MKTKLSNSTPILCLALFAIGAILTSTAFSYGPQGHETVGAMADILIANSPNTVAQVHHLIGNDTLQHAATWADRCKTPHPTEPAMIAFVNANPHTPASDGPHDHHAYHYTDIPIQESHYRASSHGAKPIDVVHMIRNCIAILENHGNATNNPTNISKDTALRLLVHYMGDVHQPLHVGAAYFGPNAQLVNPNIDSTARPDLGGNDINFVGGSLHHYWDTITVQNAMSAATGHVADRILAESRHIA